MVIPPQIPPTTTTRWNSTYLMFKSTHKYQLVFRSLHLANESYKHWLAKEELERVEKFVGSFFTISVP